MKILSAPNDQGKIVKMGGSLKLLLKKHWVSLIITSIFSGLLLTLPTIFYLLNLQIDQFVNSTNDQQQITVFLNPEIEAKQRESVLTQIRALPMVSKATFIDSDQALKSIQHLEGINTAINLLGGINPLHPTIVITPTEILNDEKVKALRLALEKTPHINEVAIDEQWLLFISRVTNKLTQLINIFAIFSALTSSTIIFYFMLVRCMSSRAEMKLKFCLGAYPWQIYQPYVGFGLVIGTVSAIIAIFLSSLCYHFYTSIWQNTVLQDLLYQPVMPSKILLYLFIISLILGLVSSTIATYIVNKNLLKHHLSIPQ